jgi:hypothetical protein
MLSRPAMDNVALEVNDLRGLGMSGGVVGPRSHSPLVLNWHSS